MKIPMDPRCLSLYSGIVGVIVLELSSCAVAPATVKKVTRFENDSSTDTRLHQLITQATQKPSSSDSAQALGEFAERSKKRGLGPVHTLAAPSAGGVAYRVHFDGGSAGCYPLGYFDQVESAHGLEVGKIAHHRRAGVGAPLIALRENRRREAIEQYFPDEAITRPLTAVATKGVVRSGIQDVEIRLLCPLVNPTVGTGRNKRPLAGDFSAAWATLLSRTGELNRNGILDVIAATPKRPPQLYLMQPYDPNKEPLIMIHGLLSTPLAWAEVSNELFILADLPFAYPLQAHSIIGNRGKPGPLSETSDGVVPYSSSHLKGAASELIVPADHGAFRHPAALAEIKRCLKLP